MHARIRSSTSRAVAALTLMLAPVLGSALGSVLGSAHAPARADEGRVELATGVHLRWLELGDPRGEPVLFLHGYTDTSRSFLPTMRALSALRPDLRLVALDQRGHGASSLPPDGGCAAAPERCFEPVDFAADALAFLDARGIERAHLVGHSLGSVVAQEIALAQPGRVSRVVLIASSARFAGNEVARAALSEGLVEGPWQEAVRARGLAYPAEAWDLTPLALDPGAERHLAESWAVEAGADPAFLAGVAREAARTPLGTWIGTLRALSEHDFRERLGELRAPTLVLWPIQDAFFPEEPDQRELREALERARARHGTPWHWKRYGRLPAGGEGAAQTDLGHNLHWSVPEAVARDLAAFLREDGTPSAELAFLEEGRPRVEPTGATVLSGAR